MSAKTQKNNTHHGWNVRRVRGFLGFTQEDLAEKMNSNQNKVSAIENSNELDEATLAQVSKALSVPVELLKNLNSDSVLNHSHDNALTPNDQAQANAIAYLGEQENIYQDSHLDKMMELFERIVKLNEENALLKQEVKMLKKQMNKK